MPQISKINNNIPTGKGISSSQIVDNQIKAQMIRRKKEDIQINPNQLNKIALPEATKNNVRINSILSNQKPISTERIPRLLSEVKPQQFIGKTAIDVIL